MKLRLKFNLILFIVFCIGIGASAYLSNSLLQQSAQDEVIQKANVIMEAAAGVRQFTTKQIKPILEKEAAHKFFPQTVPAYAATEVFNMLRQAFPDYSYKEATLNPTNLRDKATDWETDIVKHFKDSPSRKEFVGIRQTPLGESLYLAKPIRVGDAACLQCHGKSSAAPKPMKF